MDQQLQYYQSQDPGMQSAYRQDMQFALSTVQALMAAAAQMKDETLAQALEQQFGQYMSAGPGVRQ